jgi:hypothetical protein
MKILIIPAAIEYGEEIARGFVMMVWMISIFMLLRFRTIPKVNQALAAALAVVLSHLVILLDLNVSLSTMLFFLGCAQFTVLVSFWQILKQLVLAKNQLETLL